MFETGETITETAKDEYGTFRSVLIPVTNKKNQTYVVGADIYIDQVKQRLHRMLLLCISIGLGSFLAVFLISIILSNWITLPLIQLAQHANQLGIRNFVADEQCETYLSKVVEIRNDEVGHLAKAFAQMLKQLEKYIDDLKVTTAIKERIESELKIAHDIQMSFLPKVFPHRKEFDLYTTLVPAKEVGGDLYDFCMIDDDHLFFYVGDVSDKGVPAALFMAVTMTLMKLMSQQTGINPAEILSRVNRDLSMENEKMLFVTLFCAILNQKTGEMVYSNAGHNPPLILRANKKAEWLKLPEGLVLAVMQDSKYQTKTTKLNKGDFLLLYTDGVTEAMNSSRQLYSEKKLLATLESLSGKSPADVVKEIVTSVTTHAAGAPQSDDITVLALRFTGSQ
jgi:sigma-B regulation protein RsbU (phosphoserine phosphatase)